jgi:site-specific recombinase XerD
MQRRRKKYPSYRLHKPTNLAVVTLSGEDIYLGKYGTRESRDAYDREIAEWLARGRAPRKSNPRKSAPRAPDPSPGRAVPAGKPAPPPPPASTGLKIKAVLLAYMDYAATYYRGPDGKPTPELDNMAAALRPVRALYADTPAAGFDSLALMAVRESMIRDGLSRPVINARVNRIRRCFRWAASRKLVDAARVYELQAVEPLQPGRSDAPERPPVEAVPMGIIEATLPHLNPIVRAMVLVQLRSGCRAGEVAIMRPCDLTMGGPNWEYRPRFHKTAWRGKTRVIPLGPRAQEVIRPFLDRDPDAHLFDPRQAVADHHAGRGSRRRSKRTPSEVARRKSKPGEDHADHYDRRTYRQAVVRACDRAFPHPELSKVRPKDLTAEQRAELHEWRKRHRWSPLQLRHTAGTLVRSQYGLEAAQLHLGHAKADVTQIYAKRDLSRAHEIAAEIG